MRDRRYYGRLKTEICANIYVGDRHREKNSTVTNISETGICFEVSPEELYPETIHVGDKIDFQFVDHYMLLTMRRSVVVSGRCIIKHIEMIKEGIRIGCFLNNGDFQEYVENRKLANTAKIYAGRCAS